MICEAFGCLPSAAREELDTDPDRLVLEVLEMRAYARTKAGLEAADLKDRPTGPMADLVQEIEVDVFRARQARRG